MFTFCVPGKFIEFCTFCVSSHFFFSSSISLQNVPYKQKYGSCNILTPSPSPFLTRNKKLHTFFMCNINFLFLLCNIQTYARSSCVSFFLFLAVTRDMFLIVVYGRSKRRSWYYYTFACLFECPSTYVFFYFFVFMGKITAKTWENYV